MRKRSDRGFTLIEVIVVAGIIAILAGILVPLILKEIDESRIARAYADVRSISSAMLIFKKDTGEWPARDVGWCQQDVTLLYGDGVLPRLIRPVNTTVISSYNDYLPADNNNCWGAPKWKGPYMARVGADPWGHAYVTNVVDLWNGSGKPVWIISAGPDGILQTRFDNTQATPANDDIGIRIK